MRVRWTVPAAEDLENIKAYLDAHYLQFAEPTVRTIYESVLALKKTHTGAGQATAPARGNYHCRRSLTL